MSFSEISIYQVKPDKTGEFENIMKDACKNYGTAQKQLYETHWKAIEKCLLVPHDKILVK